MSAEASIQNLMCIMCMVKVVTVVDPLSGLTRRPRSHNIFGSGAAGSLPQTGLVHFSDVGQLRAAAKEMHDFRLVSNVSRSTGFGQTQSVSYLRCVCVCGGGGGGGVTTNNYIALDMLRQCLRCFNEDFLHTHTHARTHTHTHTHTHPQCECGCELRQ